MNERIERDNPVIKAMHKAKPARVRVVERGGAAKEVRLTQGRNRWRALADMLEAVAWERVEGLDEQGAVLVVCQSGDDDDEGEVVEQTSERVDDVRALVGMMQKVQADTLREARAIYAAQADAMSRVLDAATESLRTAQQAFDMALKVQAAAMTRSDGEQPDGANVMQMLQMAMMMGNANRGAPKAPAAPLKAVPAEGGK